MTKARSAPKKNPRFPRQSFRSGSNANNPYAVSGKKNVSNATRKLPSVPAKNGK